MNDVKKVEFDPGYAPLVIDSIGQIGYTYYMFSASKNIRIKKINFPMVFRKIENLLKVNVSFYLGCLLWACYISSLGDCEIEGNKLLGEKADKDEYTSEISFLIDLVEKGLMRDCKYYLNKPYNPDSKYLPVLKSYKEFLIINNGFIECSNTNQIKLPESIKKSTKTTLKEIKKNIDNAIGEKDITKLLDSFELIF